MLNAISFIILAWELNEKEPQNAEITKFDRMHLWIQLLYQKTQLLWDYNDELHYLISH